MKQITSILILCLVLCVSSCGGATKAFKKGTPYVPPVSSSETDRAADMQREAIKQLIAQSSNSQSPQRELYLLQAAYLLAEQQQVVQAQTLVSQVNTASLTPESRYLYELVNIDILRQQAQITAAAQRMQALQAPAHISPTTQIVSHELRAKLYAQQGDILASIRERVILDTILTDPNAQKQNRQRIWYLVQSLPTHILQEAQEHNGSIMDGWLQLGVIMNEYQGTDKFPAELQQWKNTYPNHPALTIMNFDIEQMAAKNYDKKAKAISPTSEFNQIALLLPVTGKLAPNATSIQDGLITAYNAAHGSTLNIKVYDTNDDKNVLKTYEQAIQEGADLVIGPLTKPGVNQINSLSRLPVPVLTLNYLHTNNRHPGELYEFGLAPEDEAREAAQFAYQQGKRKPLILVQADEWGKRVSDAFIDEWYKLGAQVTSKIVFNSSDNISHVISQALHIQLTKEQTERLTSKPKRRSDIDMIFLAANAGTARQIKPLLDFYYANDLTVYGTSSLYALPPNITLDRDLNGVYFCDMPWVIDPNNAEPQLHATINELWPDKTPAYARFFAMGVDAYNLTTQLPQLRGSTIEGVTGNLYLASDGRIIRQVECASFQNGKPQLR